MWGGNKDLHRIISNGNFYTIPSVSCHHKPKYQMRLQTNPKGLITFKSNPMSSYEEQKCTHRTSRRRTLGRYVGEHLRLQRKFCNTPHSGSPVLLTTSADVSPAGFENLLAGERKLPQDHEGALVKHAWGSFHETDHESFLKAAFLP